jgi:DNA-directed RNA polymerase subunit M/transcription elongation factor TFIIS
VNAKRAYEEWKRRRDDGEPGLYCLVKLVCDSCGYRWIEDVRLTLPPCPKCGSGEVYEYETLQVG